MEWRKGLSFTLKGIGAVTNVAEAVSVLLVSMVGSAAAMGAMFLDGKAEKKELESKFKRMSLGITSVQDENKVNREEMADRMEEVERGQEDVKSDVKALKESAKCT